MHDLSLRRIDMRQLTDIQRVIQDAFSAAPWYDDWHDPEQFDRYIADLVDQPCALALGLYAGDALIGVSLGRVIHWYAGTQYRIDDLGISSAHQGQGMGTLFMRMIESYAAQHGIGAIALKTSREAAAYRFYLKNGFEAFAQDVYFEKTIRKAADQQHTLF